ncbi:MAG: class I SAM-dependent methyltransferase [Myxococcota bacterium]
MSEDVFSILGDDKVAGVLRRLHAEADRQMPGLMLHYLPKLPRLLLGRALHFDEQESRGFYADKYIALEREQAAFCHLTARALRARLVVEFGSSLGISTLWLAAAVRANGGGRVIGTEIVPEKAERARAHVEEAGLSEFVEIREGDALKTLRDLPKEVDLLLNDGFPNLALEILQLVAPCMRPGAVVITDNVGTFKGNYREYVEYLRNPAHGFCSTNVPFKSGTEYSVRTGPDSADT